MPDTVSVVEMIELHMYFGIIDKKKKEKRKRRESAVVEHGKNEKDEKNTIAHIGNTHTHT